MPVRKSQAPPDFYLKARGAAITPSERELIKDQATLVAHRTGPECVVVNIGVGYGATMHCLCTGAPECKLIGIDMNPERLHPQFEEYLQPLELILGDSRSSETQDQCEGPIHILLIDGNHYLESVRGDIQGWVPKVAVGGVVMFHDFSHPQGDIVRLRGIRKAVEEWQASEDWSGQWQESGHEDSVIVFERVQG